MTTAKNVAIMFVLALSACAVEEEHLDETMQESAGTSRLYANQSLYPDQSLRDALGGRLIYQRDGNLVYYDRYNSARWSSKTAGTSLGRTIMQGDGNLVIYNASNSPVWHTGTHGNPGAFLALNNNQSQPNAGIAIMRPGTQTNTCGSILKLIYPSGWFWCFWV